MTKKQWYKEYAKADADDRQILNVELDRVEFQAQRKVTTKLFGAYWTFDKGDLLIVTTPASKMEIEAGIGDGGPWGWGGFTSRFIAKIGMSFENPQTGEKASI